MYRVFVAVIASSIAMSAAIAGTPRQQSGWVVIDTHIPSPLSSRGLRRR